MRSIGETIMTDDVTLWSIKARINMASLLGFINLSIQDVSVRTVGGKVTL